MLSEAVMNQTEDRFRGRATERSATIKALKNGILAANDPKYVAARRRRITGSRTLSAATSTALRKRGASPDVLERVLLDDDLLNINYLEIGLRASRAVGRIQVREPGGTPIGWGTGFLIGPGVLLTNHHVLPDMATAGASRLQMPGEDDVDGNPLAVEVFNLDPATFFATSPAEALDYTMVAVTPGAGDGLGKYGFNRLISAQGKLLKGEDVTIIQFPGGGQKQIALRQNRVVDILDHFLHYETDTAPGSSGSPVFNDQWEVVALHHSGVPERKNGQVIDIQGKPWTQAEGEDQVHWIANEGVRISVIVSDLAAQTLTGSSATTRDAILAGTSH